MTATLTELVARFAPVFDEVGADAALRDRERRLPYAEVDALRRAGFTRVTLPEALGGDDADATVLFELLAELGRRDPNLAQLLRSHFSFVDRTLVAPDTPERTARLAAVAAGRIVGNASHERSGAKVGSLGTRVAADADGALRLDGTKYYSTGTLFADLVSVAATRAPTDEPVAVLVPTDAEGVDRVDDWTGFGQRTTGSGTTVFAHVAVAEDDVAGWGGRERPSAGSAFVQLVLLAALAGIGRAVVDDAVRFVRARTRVYSHGSAPAAKDDPIVQEVVGDLAAASFAADAALASSAATLAGAQRALRADAAGTAVDRDELIAVVHAADLAATRAQLVIVERVLTAATALFEVGGASALDAGLGLDRHWRNARTLASHNPARYKARTLGDHLLNDVPVVSWWSTGEG